MATKPLVPNDPRVETRTAKVRGKTYSYIYGEPEGTPIATIFLIHGFPDISFGWRHQIPYLMALGFKVVAPDMLGYGGTDAPEDLEQYSHKSMATDIKELAHQIVGNEQIVLGGHDWGGMTVWRIAMWYPSLVRAVFSVCTPYSAPSKEYDSLEARIAAGTLLNFRYQLQFMGPEVEARIRGATAVRQFLNALHGGTGPGGEKGFSTHDGVLFDKLPLLQRSRLFSEEELAFYTQQYLRHEPELRGPLNWYRTREMTYREELEVARRGHRFEMPALFIGATDDAALPPWMSRSMESHFDQLTRGEVKASHWALSQAAGGVNKLVGEWLGKVFDDAVKASL